MAIEENGTTRLPRKDRVLDILGIIVLDAIALAGIVATIFEIMTGTHTGSELVGIVVVMLIFLLLAFIYTIVVARK